jgi:hypothetical protein
MGVGIAQRRRFPLALTVWMEDPTDETTCTADVGRCVRSEFCTRIAGRPVRLLQPETERLLRTGAELLCPGPDVLCSGSSGLLRACARGVRARADLLRPSSHVLCSGADVQRLCPDGGRCSRSESSV